MISTTNISMLNIEELMAEVIKVWRGLPDAYLEEICTSMRRRCTAIIRNNGYPIKYLNFHSNKHICA